MLEEFEVDDCEVDECEVEECEVEEVLGGVIEGINLGFFEMMEKKL